MTDLVNTIRITVISQLLPKMRLKLSHVVWKHDAGTTLRRVMSRVIVIRNSSSLFNRKDDSLKSRPRNFKPKQRVNTQLQNKWKEPGALRTLTPHFHNFTELSRPLLDFTQHRQPLLDFVEIGRPELLSFGGQRWREPWPKCFWSSLVSCGSPVRPRRVRQVYGGRGRGNDEGTNSETNPNVTQQNTALSPTLTLGCLTSSLIGWLQAPSYF